MSKNKKMCEQIRLQAEDFYNAYRVLDESNEAMMDMLEKLSGKPLVAKSAFGSHPVSTPSIVCLAFALELYMKHLHVVLETQKNKVEEVKAPRGHNILELFKKLPPEIQQEIRDYPTIQKLVAYYSMQLPLYIPIDKSKQPITDTLEQQIYKISEAFQKWRYSYEGGALTFEYYIAFALAEAVRYIADKARNGLV